MSLKKSLKEKFDYDVTNIPAWTDNSMPNIIPDVIENSTFLSSLTLEEGVKGTKEIALLNSEISLQAKEGCTQSPDGSVIFTKKNLVTKLLYSGIEFCNEDLNGKMTQVLNEIGLKRQNGQLPADLDTILMAYLAKKLMKKAQDVVLLGDTTSINPDLDHFDGLVKLLDTSVTVVEATSTETTIDETNAYDLAKLVYGAIPAELFDNGYVVNIYTGRTEAIAILEQWNQANPYSQVSVPSNGTSFEFDLPLFGIRVIALPQLTGKNKMYAMPIALVFLGTDLMEDMQMDIKYDDYNDKLKAEASFRLGTNFVWDKYFVRLKLANS
jgi:hypothetical protein